LQVRLELDKATSVALKSGLSAKGTGVQNLPFRLLRTAEALATRDVG
jgi:hypothetical protein